MKLNIKNTEIEIKNKIRALIIYELLTNKAFNPITLTDIVLYFYSLILANKPDIVLTFNEFMDYLDENPEVMNEFNQWILDLNKMNVLFTDLKKKKESL